MEAKSPCYCCWGFRPSPPYTSISYTNNTIVHSIGFVPIFFSTPTMATPGGGFFVSGVDNQANAGISIPHHPPMMHLNPRCCFHIATSLPEENRAPHSQTEFPFQNPHLSHNNHIMFIRRPSPLLKSPSVDSESSDPAANSGACYYRGGGGFCGSPVAAAAGPTGRGGMGRDHQPIIQTSSGGQIPQVPPPPLTPTRAMGHSSGSRVCSEQPWGVRRQLFALR